jgi:hypothetical protein
MIFKLDNSGEMEDDFILPKMPPTSSRKMVIVPPEKYEKLKSIIEEVSKRNWFWPMKCELCRRNYPDHYDFCLAARTNLTARAKEVLEELEHE